MAGGADRYVTRAEYARLRKVSRAAVTQWVAAGKVVTGKDGRIAVEASDRLLADTTNQARGGKGGTTSAAAAAGLRGSDGGASPAPDAYTASEGAGAAGDASSPPRDAQDQGGMTLARANTARAAIQARMLEQEYRVRTGQLVDRRGYDRALADALGPLLSQLGTLSARLGPQCAAESDVRRVQALIDDEVDRLRREIAARVRALAVAGDATRQ